MADVPEHALTVEYVFAVVTFAILVGGGIWRIRVQLDEKIEAKAKAIDEKIEAKVAAVEQELATQVDRVKGAFGAHQQQHNDFKLEVAQTYASQTHLRETEERLVSAINKLDATIAAMPASIVALIKSGQRAVRGR